MTNPTGNFNDERLDRALATSSDARLQRFMEGMNALTQWRERNANALEVEARSNDWLKAHVALVDDASDRWGKGVQAQADSAITNREVWKELRPLWMKAFNNESAAGLADIYSQLNLPLSGFEQHWLPSVLGGKPQPWSTWRGTASRLGLTYVDGVDTADTPAAPPPATEDVGTVRQALDDKPPVRSLCLSAPYQNSSSSSSRDGVAVITNRGGVDTQSGSGFIDTMSFAPVLAGGGGSVAMTIGRSVAWPKGYEALTVSVAFTFNASMIALAVLGGATTSLELVVLVAFSDGRQELQTSFIGAATAPLLFGCKSDVPQTTRTLINPNLALDGTSGNAIILAGLRGYSAAVGIVGSSAARVQANFVVNSICTTVR